MSSPMSKVSSLVSSQISNYLTNVQTWGGIVYNVKSYGAKSDGETNDTLAVQATINAAPQPSIVYIPTDTVYTYDDLTLKDNVTIWDNSDARFYKIYLRGIQSGETVYENEFQILANYNPGFILDNIGSEIGKRVSIVFRRNGDSYWQIGDDPSNDGTVKFFIQQIKDASGVTIDTTRFAIDSTGKVGIKTAAPASTLHVSGTDSSTATFENTASTLLITLKSVDNSHRKIIQLGSDNILKVNKADNSATIFQLTDTGVGIYSGEVRGVGFRFDGTGSGPILKTGSGSPEGVVTAPVGSLYTRTDGGAGTTLYVKESGTGNTGWVAK